MFQSLAVKEAVRNGLPSELWSFDFLHTFGDTNQNALAFTWNRRQASKQGAQLLFCLNWQPPKVLLTTVVVSFWKCIYFQLGEPEEPLCMVLATFSCPLPDRKCSLWGADRESHGLLPTRQSIALLFTGSPLLDARSKAAKRVSWSDYLSDQSGEGSRDANNLP